MNIKIIVFKSPLHDINSIYESRELFFEALKSYNGVSIVDALNYKEVDKGDLTFCFIATGGTEELFRTISSKIAHPVRLISDGYHNSLAASFEIATWLTQNSIPHQLINIPFNFKKLEFIDNFLLLERIYNNNKVKEYLSKSVIGLIGGESSWLISSQVDKDYLSRRHGVKFVDIPIDEIVESYNKAISSSQKRGRIEDAETMSEVLYDISQKYHLTALTIKCFDLLTPCNTTACLALANLNDRGIVSGCEGDIPTLWSMMIAFAMTGKPSFMVNPSSSSQNELTVDFAHCTIPLSMVDSFSLPTHFESSIGVGVAGKLPLGRYSLFKIGGKYLDNCFHTSGEVICNTTISQRCRTQVGFRFDTIEEFNTFFNNRLGNHLILNKFLTLNTL
jgi:L-fucose isomerase-like protein